MCGTFSALEEKGVIERPYTWYMELARTIALFDGFLRGYSKGGWWW